VWSAANVFIPSIADVTSANAVPATLVAGKKSA
jgi:hypothetical protein